MFSRMTERSPAHAVNASCWRFINCLLTWERPCKLQVMKSSPACIIRTDISSAFPALVEKWPGTVMLISLSGWGFTH